MSRDNVNQNLWVTRREGADLWCCLLWCLTTWWNRYEVVSLFCTTYLWAIYWSVSSPGEEHVQAPQWNSPCRLLKRSRGSRRGHTNWIRSILANVTGEVRRGESGPTALHTRMGWVLSGPIESSMCDCDPSINLVSSIHVLKFKIKIG